MLRKPFTNASVTASSSSPREYIYHALRLFSLVYKVILMKRLWFNGSDFLNVLNSVSQEYDLSTGNIWVTLTIIQTILTYLLYFNIMKLARFSLTVHPKILSVLPTCIVGHQNICFDLWQRSDISWVYLGA